MSDTGESDMSQSGTGSSCSWAVVDQLGNLQDDDSVSTGSSVEVVNEEEEEYNPTSPDGATPIGGNSPQGHLNPSPKFVLRLPSREHEVSDTDEETSPATDDISGPSSLEISPLSTQGTTLPAGSAVMQVDRHGQEPMLSISGENDSVLSSMFSRISPPQTISSEHIESLVKAIDDVHHSLTQSQSGDAQHNLSQSHSGDVQHNLSQPHSGDVQHSLSQPHSGTSPSEAQSLDMSSPNSEQSFGCPNSFSSMEMFGSNKKEESSKFADISKTMPENLPVRQTSKPTVFENIGIQSYTEDKPESIQSSLSSTFSLLSESEGNQFRENVAEDKQKENEGEIKEAENVGEIKEAENDGEIKVEKNDGENEPETLTTEVVTPDDTAHSQESASIPRGNVFTTIWSYLPTNMYKHLCSLSFVTFLTLFICCILMNIFNSSLYPGYHHERLCNTCEEIETKAFYTTMELNQCRVSLNDAKQANQDFEIQIGKLRYADPEPQVDEQELDENKDIIENQINRDKLDRARWEIYGKRQSEWNLLKLKEKAIIDLNIAETELNSLRDAKVNLEAELVQMAEDITDVKKVIKKLKKTKIDLLLQKSAAEQEFDDKQENVHNAEENAQNCDKEKMKLKENTRQSNDDEEDSRHTKDYSDDKAAASYKACWNMMEDMYQKQFSQLFDLSWVDVKSNLLDEYMKTYLPENMFEFFFKMNQKKQNAEKYSQQGTEQPSDDTQDKTSTDFKKDAGGKQSQNEKNSQSRKSGKPGTKNEEKQSKKTEPLPSWADTMMDMMNKTKSQIQDTWQQVRNMSDTLWNKHEPSLKKLEATFTKKLKNLSDKFQAKIAKKARKWFNKSSKQDKNQNEKTEGKKTAPNAGTKRRGFSGNGDIHENKNIKEPVDNLDDPAKPEITESITCSHKLLVLDRIIAQMKCSSIRKQLNDMVVTQMQSNLRELENLGLVNGDVYQMKWVRCQSDWWRMYDNPHYAFVEDCTPYLRCWQIRKTKGHMCGQLQKGRFYVLDRYCDIDETIAEVKFEQDIYGDFFVASPREFYLGSSSQENTENEKSEKLTIDVPYKPNSDGTVNSVNDVDEGDDDIADDAEDYVDDDVDFSSNWYLERIEDREYHHQEPDDWFFRRGKKSIKIKSVETLEEDKEVFEEDEEKRKRKKLSCIDF